MGEGEKKLSDREGCEVNPQYGNGNRVKFRKKNVTNTFIIPDEIPKEKEAKFVRANHIFYVVLTPGLEVSEKLITFCCGCGGKIKLHEKKFPNNMVFHYRARRMIPENGNKKKWVMSKDKQNCYYHSSDLICLRNNDELKDCQITDVYMDNKSFKMLKKENKEELRHRSHWNAIIDGQE